MRSKGFRKEKLGLFRWSEDLAQVLDFQVDTLRIPGRSSFTVNLQVCLPFFHEMYVGEAMPQKITTAAPCCYTRIGYLEGNNDLWWESGQTDYAQVCAEVLRLIEGKPADTFWQEVETPQKIIEAIDSEKSIWTVGPPTLIQATLWCYLGQRDQATFKLAQYETEGGDSEVSDIFRQRLRL